MNIIILCKFPLRRNFTHDSNNKMKEKTLVVKYYVTFTQVFLFIQQILYIIITNA
jgi:hypothetical protein